jgi:hypothetical protein
MNREWKAGTEVMAAVIRTAGGLCPSSRCSTASSC